MQSPKKPNPYVDFDVLERYLCAAVFFGLRRFLFRLTYPLRGNISLYLSPPSSLPMVERTADGRLRTTEWEDIQYKHGNRVGQYRDREIDIVAQKLADANPDAQLESYDPIRERVQEKLERGGYEKSSGIRDEVDHGALASRDVDDDGAETSALDDDDALELFRQRRLREMQQSVQSAAAGFGRLKRITKASYVEDITNASLQCPVLAVMAKDGHDASDALLRVMSDVCGRQTSMKFVCIPAEEAISMFPAKHIPCCLIYQQGKLVHQVTGLDTWGGKQLSVSSCERALRQLGLIAARPGEQGSDDDDDEGASSNLRGTKLYAKGLVV